MLLFQMDVVKEGIGFILDAEDQIQIVLQQGLLQGCIVTVESHQIDLRVELMELRNQGGHQQGVKDEIGADPQLLPGGLVQLAQFLGHLLIQFQDPTGISDHDLSSFRGNRFSGCSNKEQGSQRSFQILDGDAECRLCHEQFLSSSMVISRIGQCAEIAQLFKIQVHDSSCR